MIDNTIFYNRIALAEEKTRLVKEEVLTLVGLFDTIEGRLEQHEAACEARFRRLEEKRPGGAGLALTGEELSVLESLLGRFGAMLRCSGAHEGAGAAMDALSLVRGFRDSLLRGVAESVLTAACAAEGPGGAAP